MSSPGRTSLGLAASQRNSLSMRDIVGVSVWQGLELRNGFFGLQLVVEQMIVVNREFNDLVAAIGHNHAIDVFAILFPVATLKQRYGRETPVEGLG